MGEILLIGLLLLISYVYNIIHVLLVIKLHVIFALYLVLFVLTLCVISNDKLTAWWLRSVVKYRCY